MSSTVPRLSDRAGPEWRRAVAGDAVELPDLLAGEALKAAPKQVRGHRARASVLAAAHDLFAQRGYGATTVEEIAKAARVAVGGFYRYFRSKRQVLLVLMRGLLDEFDARHAARQFNEAPADALERVRQALQMGWVHAGAYRAWREAVAGDRALAALHSEIEVVTIAWITSALAIAATAPGRRHDVDLASLATIVNAVHWRLFDAPADERRAISEALVRLIQHALYEDTALESTP